MNSDLLMTWVTHAVETVSHSAVFILVIGILIVIHELGHFLFAKWCGVGVVKFAIGFGPALWKKQIGETVYQVGAIPLGGFVRMIGDMPDVITGPQASDDLVREEAHEQPEPHEKSASEIEEESSVEYQKMLADKNRWFIHKPLLHRTSIVIAGPLFNWLLAGVLLIVSVAFYGLDASSIGEVFEGSPASHAGLMPGDKVLSIDSKPIKTWEELALGVQQSGGKELAFKIQRQNASGIQEVDINVTPELKVAPLGSSRSEAGKKRPGQSSVEVYLIGIAPGDEKVRLGLGTSLTVGSLSLVSATTQTFGGIWGMLRGQVSPKELAGPIFVFSMAGKQAKKGLQSLLQFMAILSVSLAVLNLLPIPVLDGGHLLFFFLEALLGPISIRKKEIAQQFGVVMLLLLMVVALKNDITRTMAPVEDQVAKDKDAQKKTWDNILESEPTPAPATSEDAKP